MMQQGNPFDAFDRPAQLGIVIQSGPPADPSKEPLTKAELKIAEAKAAQAAAQAAAQTRIDNANADSKERENRDAAAADQITTMRRTSNASGPAYLATLPADRRAIVSGLLQGNLPVGARGLTSPQMIPYIQDAINVDPSFSANTFAARQKAVTELASSKATGGYLATTAAAIDHSREMELAIAALHNPSGWLASHGGAYLNYKLFNEGRPADTTFAQANRVFAGEQTKGIVGNIGTSGQTAVSDRKEGEEAMNPRMAQDSLYAGVRTGAQQLYQKLRTADQLYGRTMNGQHIPNIVTPEQAKQLIHLMRIGNDGKEGPLPPGIDKPFLGLAGVTDGGVGGGGSGTGSNGPPSPTSPRQQGIAGGDTRTVSDPRANSIIASMIRAGATAEQINSAIKPLGFGEIGSEQVAGWQKFLKDHPGFSGNVADASHEVPTSGWNRFTASPVGTGIYAAIDQGMGGMSDEITSALGGGDLADLNARKQAVFAANPKSAFVGQMAGYAAAMAGVGKLAGPLGLGKGAALASDVGFSALSGAGQDNDNRTMGAIVGALTAGAGHGVGALAAKPIGALAQTEAGSKAVDIARLLADKVPGVSAPPITRAAALNPAEQSLMTTVDKAGTNKVLDALANGASLNAPITLADTAPSLGELAGAAVRRSPVAREFAEPVLSARSQGQIGRFGDAVERNLGPTGNTLEISKALSAKARTDAGPLYDAAYGVPTPSTPELDSLLNTPFGRESIGKARTIAANERQSPTELGFALDADGNQVLNPRPNRAIADNLYARQELDAAQDAYRLAKTQPGDMTAATTRLENARQGYRDTTAALNVAPDPNAVASVPGYTTNALDYAKRGMDDVLEQHRNKLTGRLELSDAGRAQLLVKNQMLSEMDRVNPAYGEARRAYQGPMESLDALHLGQDLYGSNINANQVASSIADKTPEHLAQAQLGYRDAMMGQADKLSYSTNPWNTLNTPAAEAKLSAMYPDSESQIAALLSGRNLERDMASTSSRIIGGSQTAGRQIADQQFMPGAGTSLAIDGATAAMGGVPMATVTRALMGSKLMDGLRLGVGRQADAKAEALIPMLLNTDADASSAIVRDLMDKSAAYQAWRTSMTPSGAFSRAGAAAAAGGFDRGMQ